MVFYNQMLFKQIGFVNQCKINMQNFIKEYIPNHCICLTITELFLCAENVDKMIVLQTIEMTEKYVHSLLKTDRITPNLYAIIS